MKVRYVRVGEIGDTYGRPTGVTVPRDMTKGKLAKQVNELDRTVYRCPHPPTPKFLKREFGELPFCYKCMGSGYFNESTPDVRIRGSYDKDKYPSPIMLERVAPGLVRVVDDKRRWLSEPVTFEKGQKLLEDIRKLRGL